MEISRILYMPVSRIAVLTGTLCTRVYVAVQRYPRPVHNSGLSIVAALTPYDLALHAAACLAAIFKCSEYANRTFLYILIFTSRYTR